MDREQRSLRREIPALKEFIYLDNAGAGLPPISVTEAMHTMLDEWSRFGERWDSWIMHVVEVRRLFAKLIGAKESEIAIVPSVSSGLSELGSCLRFKKNKVVTSSLNFPTNVIIWQRMKEFGLIKEVIVLEDQNGQVPFERWERAIDEETAVVAVDYVSWLSGYRERVREIVDIAHRKGSLVIVDSFHALGVFPVDVKKDGIDAMVCGFYKWLCGPHGVACIYARDELLDSLEPAYIGWYGIEDNVIERLMQGRDPFDRPFPLNSARPSRTASRFEWGTWALIAVRGAVEALKFALQNDPSYRFNKIKKLVNKIIYGLDNMGLRVLARDANLKDGSGIVTFPINDHKPIVSKLTDRKIIVSGRFNHIRISPHFYNTQYEVEELIQALGKLI